METLLRDIRYGIRLLSNRPAFAVIAVRLGLGIGAHTAIFSVVTQFCFARCFTICHL